MIFLPAMFLALAIIGYFLVLRVFSMATVWLMEDGWYRFIDGYELMWDKVRMPTLLIVGVLCAGFFVFSAIMGFLAHQREVRNGHR